MRLDGTVQVRGLPVEALQQIRRRQLGPSPVDETQGGRVRMPADTLPHRIIRNPLPAEGDLYVGLKEMRVVEVVEVEAP